MNKITLYKRKSNHYKLLSLLSMIYVTIMLISIVMSYKLTHIGSFSMSPSSIVIPFWFVLGDIIAEVYGYKVARIVVWSALICEAIFIFSIYGLIQLPSPDQGFWHNQESFNAVFGKFPKVFVGSFTGIFLGSFINVYAITKWKILLRGKYFWLRSMGACAIGETVFTLVNRVL